MSYADSVNIGAFLAQQGLVNLGQFTGLSIGKGILASAQGPNLALNVAPGGGAGTVALAQGSWAINALTGDDDASGLPGAPLKTLAELSRRWGVGNRLPGVLNTSISPIQQIDVTLETDIPASDPLTIDVVLPGNALLAFVGTMIPVRSGALTAVVTKDRPTNTPWGVSDAVTPFTAADVGRRIRITAGPNIGQFAWITKVTAGVARCTSFSSVTMATPTSLIQTGVTTGVVAITDPYVIENPSTLTIAKCNVFSPMGGTGTNTTVGFMSLAFQNAGGFTALGGSVSGTCTPIAKGCRYQGQLLLEIPTVGRPQFLNCWVTGSGPFGIGLNRVGPVFRSGGTANAISSRVSLAIIDDDFMVQGIPGVDGISGDLSTLIGTACVFDAKDALAPGSGTGPSSCLRNLVSFSGVAAIWGAGNAGFGYKGGGGSKMSIPSAAAAANITVTGALGDFSLSTGVTSSPWDQTAAAGAGAYLVPRANTWANLALAVGAGGFGGGAHNVDRDAHIVVA